MIYLYFMFDFHKELSASVNVILKSMMSSCLVGCWPIHSWIRKERRMNRSAKQIVAGGYLDGESF